MRTSLNHLRFPSRSLAAKAWIILLVALTFSLSAAVVSAQNNSVVVSQAVRLFTLTYSASGGSGWDNGASPLGGTFAVNQIGNVVFWSEYGQTGLFLINSQTGAMTQLNSVNNAGAVAIDNQNNIYFAQTYSSQIAKIPYDATTGTYAAYPAGGPASTAICKGAVNTTTDTTTCIFALNLQDKTGYYGNAALAIDGSGDFIVATNQWPGQSQNNATINNSILLCNAACQTGTQYDDAPTVIYTDSTATDAIGAIAVDPWGNIFFTDGAFNETAPGNGGPNTSSGLYEIPLSSGKYATTPTTLVTFTNTQSYNDDLSGVTIDQNGTVYYTITGGGVFAIPNTQNGGPVVADTYVISTVGGKGLTLDASGNVYVNAYSGTDGVTRVSVGNLAVSGVAVGKQQTSTTVDVVLNDSNCSSTPAPSVTFTTPSKEFTAAVTPPTAPATTSCSTFSFGASGAVATLPITATFTPANVGERVGVLTATDQNSNVGTAVAAGVGQGPLVTLDPGVWTSYTTGFTTPYSVSVDAAGDLAIADEGADKVFEIVHGTTTPVAVGSGFTTPYATAFDANGNLFVADGGANDIVEIPNVSGTLNTAGQTTVVADTVLFGGTALKGPSGLAFGPDGVLYIADLNNGRVVTWNPGNGFTGVSVTGLSFPWGVAVDAADTLYVAETGGGKVWVYPSNGAAPFSLAPEGVTAPWGVAVDASGSVVISDKASGDIVRVPNVGGTLKAANALTIETNPDSSALGLALDANGNLYSTDGSTSGPAVYAVNRLAGALAFPTTDDTGTSTLSIWLESAGNTSMQISGPTKSGTAFKLVEASTDPCGVSLGAGAVCAQGVEFDPAAGIAVGTKETGTVTLATNALNAPSPTVSLTGTTAAAPLAQTVTFHNPFASTHDMTTYGVGLTTLTATASSGLVPVTFSVTAGPATIVSGDKLKVTGAGSVTVKASQAGNSTYAAASATITITVDKAVLTFKAGPEPPTTWGTPFKKPYPYKVTGFVNGDTKKLLKGAPKLTPTVSDTALPVPATYIGALVITRDTLVPLANYSFKFVPGNLTILAIGKTAEPVLTPAPTTITTPTVTVTISDPKTKGAVYYVTVKLGLKGKTPTVGNKTELYTKPITLIATSTVEVVAQAPGYTPSTTVVGTYLIK